MVRSRRIAAVAVMAVATLSASGCGIFSSAAEDIYNDSQYKPDRQPIDILNDLEVKESDQSRTYLSSDFPYWLQASDAMGWPKETNRSCNAKMAAMWRDGHDMKWANEGRCVMGPEGGWIDLYAEDDPLDSPDMEQFEVDHIVSTPVAWSTGAMELEIGDRERISNDPLNLQTAANSQLVEKNNQPADGYIPPGDFKCEYVSRYVQVKEKYDLWVTQQEKDALSEQMSDCGQD